MEQCVKCVKNSRHLTLTLPDLIINSPYYLSYKSCDVSSENFVLDQLVIPRLIFFFILINCLQDNVLILKEKFCLVTDGIQRVKGSLQIWFRGKEDNKKMKNLRELTFAHF